jgi:precorrin-3B methylase
MAIEFQSISIVGCGPGSLDYLTPAALRAIEQAEVLVGAKRLLDLFAASPAERIVVGAEIGEVLDHIAVRADRQRIAVLVTATGAVRCLAKPVMLHSAFRLRSVPGVLGDARFRQCTRTRTKSRFFAAAKAQPSGFRIIS